MDARQLDLLAYPTVQVFSPARDEPAEWTTLTFPTNTVIASQAWMPAMSLPAGFPPEARSASSCWPASTTRHGCSVWARQSSG